LPSLRAISSSLDDDELSTALRLDSISFTQISRRLADLAVEITQTLFKDLVLQFVKEAGVGALSKHQGCIHLIDSSTISLCLSQYGWADFRKTRAGVKIHLGLRFCEEGVLPEHAVITPARPADKTQMDALVVEGEGVLNVFPPGLCGLQKVVIITNDFALSTKEIGDIYRNRWQIELFFKWIKQHLNVKHFHGTSEAAVENQLFIALSTYCLMKLLELKTGYKGSLLTIQRLLHTCLYEPFNRFVQKLYAKIKRSSKGRRRYSDHELIYQETLRQVIAGEADHLDDPAYDPIIL